MTEDKKSDEQWVMSGPSDNKVSDFLAGESFDDISADPELSSDPSLEGELANWGMDIPPALMSKNDESSAVTLDVPDLIDDEEFSFLDSLGEDRPNDYETDSPSLDEQDESEKTSLLNDLEEEDLEIGLSEEDKKEIMDSPRPDLAFSEEESGKTSILDHLGKNFFEEDELTSEHSIDDLVKDVDLEEVTEFKSNLHELSSELKGDESGPAEPVSSTEDEESFPEESDLEYPDLTQLTAPEENDDVILPDSDDLEYPGELKSESRETVNESNEPTSKLIPADELSSDLDADNEAEETDPSYNITQEMKNDLASEIEKDDEVDPDDFWATDDFPKIKKTLDKPITEVQASKQIKEDFFKGLDEEDNFKIIPSKRFSSITLDEVTAPTSSQKSAPVFDENMEAEIVEKVKEALTPALEKIVKDLFSEKIEKIAWEVIPDLAENIIKHEVEEIAKQVYLSKDSDKK